jgi:hypothetical protein
MACIEKRDGFIVCTRDYLQIPFTPRVDFVGSYSLCVSIMEPPSPEPWSKRIYLLKGGHRPSLFAATDVLVAWARRKRILSALPPGRTVVVGAIPHESQSLQPGESAYILGSSLARAFGFGWRPELLKADPHQSFHNGRVARSDRLAALGYRCGDSLDQYAAVVIVDDIITTGATFQRICEALAARRKVTAPLKVVGVTFAKKEGYQYNLRNGVCLSNDHLDQTMEEMWSTAMKRYQR